jgi:hypothetical protein
MSTSPSTYLRYLPAVYSGTDSGFAGDYLNIFEKLLTGIDDGTLDGRRGIQELLTGDVIGNLFYPRLAFLFAPSDTDFIPPISGAPPEQKAAILADLDRYIGVPAPAQTSAAFAGNPRATASGDSAVQAWLNGFLNWLGGWVALAPNGSWSLDKKRTVIAQILALYRLRGTPQGLGFLVDLLLDLPMTIQGITYQPPDDGLPATTVPVEGPLTVTIANPAPACITAQDDPAKAFVLCERFDATAPVVSGYSPWVFDVTITLPNAGNPAFVLTQDNIRQILQLQGQLQHLLMSIKPAATRFVIGIVPTLELQAVNDQTSLCNAATLGVNTLLGIGAGPQSNP